MVNSGRLYGIAQDVAALQNGTAGLVRQDPTSHAISVGGETDGTSVSFANRGCAARTLSGMAAGQVDTSKNLAV